MDKNIRGIEPEAMRLLTDHHWPGNIRELENTMERAVLMAEGDAITTRGPDLFFAGEGPEGRTTSGSACPRRGSGLEDAERELIVQALERAGWVQKDAARLLGRLEPGAELQDQELRHHPPQLEAEPVGSRRRERAGTGRIRTSRRTQWALLRWFF